MMPCRLLGSLLAMLFVLGTAQGVLGQDATPEPRTGDGTIRGRLVYRDGRGGAADAPIVLYALSASGDAGVSRTSSDADGRFEFAGIANDDTSYLVGARVAGIPFGETVRFASGETLREIEIEVFDAIQDTRGVAAGPLALRIAQGCTHLRVWHSQSLRNDSSAVVLVPESERATHEPIAAITLPEGAAGFEVAMGVQGIEQAGREVRFWGPLYPGSQEVEFGYGLPIEAAVTAVSLTTSSGASEVSIRIPEGHAELVGPGLRALGSTLHEGLPHAAYAAGPLAPGAPLSLELATPPFATGDLRAIDARLLLELDDVMLDVSEFHRLEASEAKAASGLPLLCLPTPDGASDLRFSGDARSMGMALDPSGVLALHGPIPAGESSFAFGYQIPTTRDPLPFERRFGVDVARLELILADTGVVAETTRLHRRRPIRNGDRNYLALEGFAIAADETVSLGLRRLRADTGMTRNRAAVASALFALLALAYLLAPLRREPEHGAEDVDQGVLSMERGAVYKAIDDLDEDLTTGKLSPEDHERMRVELRARAVELLRRERETAHPAPTKRALQFPGCGVEVGPDDRFCSQCGHALGAAPEPTRADPTA